MSVTSFSFIMVEDGTNSY